MGRQSREKAERRKAAQWDPFRPATLIGTGNDAAAALLYDQGFTEIWKNNHYQVFVRYFDAPEPFGRGAHLSIKRNDREPIHDWRELQRIKTEIVGPEGEAVELYPAESRVVDTANQYHLWVFAEYRFPFGFDDGRVVLNSKDELPPGWAEISASSKQRPLGAPARP